MRRNQARFRPAFTMIELMTAIIIILILAGILIVGLKSVMGGSKGASTKTMLQNAQGMYAELDAKGTPKMPIQWWLPPANLTLPSPPSNSIYPDDESISDPQIDFWNVPDVVQMGTINYPKCITAPGGVQDTQPDRTGHYAIRNTAIAMIQILSVPDNRTKLSSIPADRQFRLPGDSPRTSKINETQGTMLLDAWGNPIIFVPASGMLVNLTDPTTGKLAPKLITSSKIRDLVANPKNFAEVGSSVTTNVDRPFFASAGPDGNFSTGDDNIYSFEQ